MSLTSGARVGPYEVISAAGSGGMGEVYRARDTRLERTVAIKILPAHLSDNPEAKQRFDREARAISSLNHPNICTLYDVGHQDGMDYLVMEFLEGETLGDRLAKGPLPSEQVLKYGIEICEGLEKAHKTGVIHRDLKPGNIMLTKAGAKLMDFGLAKAATASSPPASSLTSSLTMTVESPSAGQPLTARGMVVGTFQYMSPEQVEGKEADARSDIFALGAVLYEMATGKHAFTGKTQASIVAAILASEPPPISAVQAMSPPALDRVVKSCLAKDPDERFQTVHDVKLQLKWMAEGGSQAGLPAPVAARRKNRERVLIAAVALCGLLAAAGIVASVLFSRKAENLRRVVRAQIGAPEHYSFTTSGVSNHVVISPDGTTIAFVAEGEGKQLLWLRPLGAAAAQSLPGTEGAYYPFWSPDSKFLGFFAGGKLKKVEATGGVVQTICDAPFGRGGSWGREGVILLTPGLHDAIYRVPDGGGQPLAVTKVTMEGPLAGDRWPYFLPDGRHFLYLSSNGDASERGVYAASLDSPDRKMILPDYSSVEYANGYLFFIKDGNLVAQSFDPDRLALSGNPVPVAAKVEFYDRRGLGDFSVSRNGVLVYRNSQLSPSRLIWLDRSGKQLGTLGEAGNYRGEMEISPDGKTAIFCRTDPADNSKSDLWRLDTQGGTTSRVTFDGTGYSAVWSPDGTQLAVAAVGGKIRIVAAGGGGTPRILENGGLVGRLSSWSRDGKTIVANLQNSGTGWDVLTVDASGMQPSNLILHSPFDEVIPSLSPDGRWLAYLSNEGGRSEVYVVPFPGLNGRWQVSNNGASVTSLAWSRDGKQLYATDAAGALMAIDVQTKGGEFHTETPRQIFSPAGGVYSFDAAPDGRILALTPVEQGMSPPITLVMNWDAEMKK